MQPRRQRLDCTSLEFAVGKPAAPGFTLSGVRRVGKRVQARLLSLVADAVDVRNVRLTAVSRERRSFAAGAPIWNSHIHEVFDIDVPVAPVGMVEMQQTSKVAQRMSASLKGMVS